MEHIHFIVDLQFGSTGKGLLAGYLAKKLEPDTLITAWGPNAGHTFIDETGKYVNICLPNGVIAPSVRRILIGPGSLINPEIFLTECDNYRHLLDGKTIMIHPHAAVVEERHRFAERGYGFKIGSTMKGVGEAMIEKIRRNGTNLAFNDGSLAEYVVTQDEYDEAMDRAKVAIVEGAQGFSLGINSGFYPHVTSRECTVQQLMVDCAIPIAGVRRRQVHGVCRTFPIRVANRFDASGKQVGTSGPCYPDQVEIQWGEIGREAELTTVTKLPRRIFTFSKQQIEKAVRMNDVDDVFVNFCNYLPDYESIVKKVQSTGSFVKWLGFGPMDTDIMERH